MACKSWPWADISWAGPAKERQAICSQGVVHDDRPVQPAGVWVILLHIFFPPTWPCLHAPVRRAWCSWAVQFTQCHPPQSEPKRFMMLIPGTHDINTCSPGSVFAWLTRQVAWMLAVSQGFPRVTRHAPVVHSVNLVDLVCLVPATFLCKCLWAPLLLFVSGVCHRFQCQF